MKPKHRLTADDLIKAEFSDLPDKKDVLAIQGSALEFLSTHENVTKLATPLTEKQFSALKKFLAKYYRHKKSGGPDPEKINAVRFSDLRNPDNETRPEDEFITGRSIATSNTGTEADSSKSFEQMEHERDRWRETLPLIEFEAFQIKTQNEVEHQPRLTLGFREAGLQMLLRRARIRMLLARE